MRAVPVFAAVLLGLGSSAFAAEPAGPSPARVRDIGGHSGKLLAFVETREGLAELERSGLGLTIAEPGVYPFQRPEVRRAGGTARNASVILLTPFSDKRDGRIGSYVFGKWPNEGGTKEQSPAAEYAAAKAAYALPRGFIKVTKATSSTRVSENFTLGDFLTKDQESTWPKYLVLDLKLVDKLELLIEALREAGYPVKRLHVMSGFRPPVYNAKEVGPGNRSAISRHMYGDAADVYPDDDGQDQMDDLNRDGRVDLADARIVADAAESVEKRYPDLAGGVGIYPATAVHGPVVHVDTRGTRARW